MKDLASVQTLWELFLSGGFLMWPIVAMSLVVLTFGIERLIALRRSRFVPRGFAAGLLKLAAAGPFDPRKVYRLCQEHPSIAATVVRAMLERLGRPLPEIEHVVDVTKEREASALYANIRPISLAVTVTPLLGQPGGGTGPGDLRRVDHDLRGPLRGDPRRDHRSLPGGADPGGLPPRRQRRGRHAAADGAV
jgi:hypothetical protein